MKQLIAIFLLIVCIQTTKAQFVTIPDANFVTWLQTNVPFAMNGNQMDTTSLAVTTRTVVFVGYENITDITGIQYFDFLIDFNCTDNSITSLPRLANTIKNLNINRNLISNITSLPDSLINLHCGGNPLTNLPTLPSKLKLIGIFATQISTFPPLPNSLEYLSCPDNQITSLPPLPNSLIYLLCQLNQLSSLPIMPTSLVTLNCSYNQLTTLPGMSSTLNTIDCSYNQLTTLPALPSILHRLDCSHNQLINLPTLPTMLTILNCSYNNISCFPLFPNMPLEYIVGPAMPQKALNINNNPFSCLPNYVGAMDSVALNYPLCVSGNTLTNPNGCATAKGIAGTVYYDSNSDCIKNSGELNLSNISVKLYDNSNVFLKQTITYNSGIYYFTDTTGTYKVVLDTINKPFIVQFVNPGIDSIVTLSPTHTLEDSVDFALTCKPGFDLGVQSIVTNGIVFPGQNHVLNVNAGDITHWYNLSCASGVSGTVSFSVNGPVTYVGPAAGALTPSVIGNIYSYNIADFGTINNSTDFKLVFQVNTTAQAGDAICVSATVTPISGDNNQNNNIYNHCYAVVNSYDPNIKEVYPTEVQIGFNDWLTYTIHFQNIGNAPAMNIRLEDNLDAKLDPETFQVINYSHNNVIDVTSNHLTVRFPNIQLADSTSNPEGSKGFVQYRIKPKANWVTDTIKNSAEIYFDYNAPIVTNTAKSYFMAVTGIKNISYLNEAAGVSPNPTNGSVTISSKYDFEKVELLSITGQILLSETVNSKSHQLQLQNFTEGIYFVRVFYPNGLSTVKKVIKQ